MTVRPILYPAILYDDAPAAIAFLIDAFGFAELSRHADGALVHNCQLVLDGNIVMASSAQRDGRGTLNMGPVRACSGLSPICLCFYVVDPDAHHARAAAACARILHPPEDYPFGGRGYSALDPEGIPWTFGNYDPFAALN
jgi:uncharacterized glyoxalase superfamily protein PhnB